MDPLSIAVGVAGLIDLCTKAGLAIKSAHDGAKIIDSKIELLDSEIRGYLQVLELMKSTMEETSVKAAVQSTGHIGNHWKNISAAADDSRQALERLNEVLAKVGKSVGVMGSTRKHFRLKFANDEIEMYRRKIKTYRDTMQISIQTVLLWNQVSHHESTDKILPGLDDLTRSIRDLAIDMKEQIASLRTMVQSSSSRGQLQTLDRMKQCVQTAADLVSSTSTTLGLADRATVVAPSELGDIFGSRTHELVMRWMEDGLQEWEDTDAPSANGPSTVEPILSPRETEDSDSDCEIEVELIQAQLKKGIAERKLNRASKSIQCFERALARLRRHEEGFNSSELHIRILEELSGVYVDQEDWTKAKPVALECLQLLSRKQTRKHTGSASRDGPLYEKYMTQALMLGKVCLNLGDPIHARIYAKKAIKGFRRLGGSGKPSNNLVSAIKVMIDACQAANDAEEGDAYKLMLDDLLSAHEQGEHAQTKRGGKVKTGARDNKSIFNDEPMRPVRRRWPTRPVRDTSSHFTLCFERDTINTLGHPDERICHHLRLGRCAERL